MTARISAIATSMISMAIVLASSLHAQDPSPGASPRLLTSTAAVQGLSRDEADVSPSVRIEGVVTFSHPSWRILFLQDDTGGIFCDPLTVEQIPLPGRRIIVHGMAANGSFLPFVNLHRMEDLGPATVWPAARPTKASELWRGRHDAGFVKIRGYVSSMQTVTNPLPLTSVLLISDGLPVEVRVLGNNVIDPQTLPNSLVEVEGVFGPTADAQRRVTRVTLQVARGEQFRVISDSSQVLSALPITPIRQLWTNDAPQANALVRLQGVVSIAETNGVYLTSEGNGVHVVVPPALGLKRGESVELTALASSSAREVNLRLVQILSRTNGTLARPVRVKAQDLPEWERYGQQVIAQGEFLHSSPEPDGWLLVMRDEGRSYEVQLRYKPSGSLAKLESGVRLRVAGTLRLLASSTSETPVARILVADEKDLTILTPPPWPLHLTLLVVSLLSVALTCGLIALGLAHRGLRSSNHRVAEAEIALRKLNSELEKRIEERTAEYQSSEERFARAFHASPAIIVITRQSDQRFIDVNDRFTEVMGYTREETIGRTSLEMGFYVDISKRQEIIETTAAGRAVRDLECTYRDKFGRSLTMLTSVERIVVKGEDSLLAFCHDITRRKRTEDALRALVSRRSLDPGDTFFTRLSRSLAEIFQTRIGLVAETPAGESSEIVTRGIHLNGQTVANFRKRIVDTPCAQVLRDGILLVPDQLNELFPREEMMAKLGAKSYFGIAVRDSQERPIGLLAIIHDAPLQVSPEHEPILRLFAEVAGVEMERAGALEAIKSAEARFRSAIEHSFECIVMTSSQMICTYVSPGVQRILGYSPQAVIGQPLVSLLWPEDQAAAEDHYRQLLEQPETHAEIEIRARHQDGSCRWIQMSDTNRLQDPNLKAIVSNLRDVTERKEAEQARRMLEVQLRQSQKMEAIGTLAGGIAHDFNNMLGIIIGQSEFARHHLEQNREASECLNHVLQASHRAKELVRQILTFSRREEFQRTILQPETILTETLGLLRSTLPASVEIALSIHSPVPTIYGNSTLIQQIVVNLATNAAQAIGDRRGRVDIQLREHGVRAVDLPSDPDLPPGGYIELSVQDNGPGIEPALVDRIFEPFFTTKGPGEGTGLGLSVVHGIVQAHEGIIQVQSILGSGTCFRIYLPVTHAVPEEVSTESQTSPPPFIQGSERILIIDDEPSLLKVGEWVLRRSGYEVTACLNPDDALEHFRASPRSFDLVITDYSMPGISGIDLALSMRELRADIPMLICTGYGAGLTHEKARLMGFRAVLQKPLELAEFSRAVRLALDDPTGAPTDPAPELESTKLVPV